MVCQIILLSFDHEIDDLYIFFYSAYITTLIVNHGGRGHKCLDYVSGIYMVHFFLCWICYHFPFNFTWWFINLITFLIMAGLSEYVFNRKDPKTMYTRLDHSISTDDLDYD